ncbi:MAG: STAS domain-containing protein [Candidatus Krumholzibacteriia bacterium]
MRYKYESQGGDLVVLTLSGKVMGGPDFEKFHADVKNLVEEGHRRFLLDFSKVDWINSTGIGIMVSAFHSIKAAEGRMVICGANKRVRGIYYVSKLDQIFETFDSCDEAMRALQA